MRLSRSLILIRTLLLLAAAAGGLLGMGLLGLPSAGAELQQGEAINIQVFVSTPVEENGKIRTERVPVEGAVLIVSGGEGPDLTVTTDAEGKVRAELAGPGRYSVELDVSSLPKSVKLTEGNRSILEQNVTPGRTATARFALGEGQASDDGVTFAKILQAAVQGLRFGLVIGITALGLSLIFGVTGLTNFAHGELVTFGAITAYAFHIGVGMPLLIAGVIAVVCGALLGAGQDILVWRPLRQRGTSLIAQLVITIGLSLLLRYVFLMLFDGRTRNYKDFGRSQPLDWVPLININSVDLGVMLLSIFVLIATGAILQKTRLGTAMRAVADNRDLASSSGINVASVITLVWALGGGLAAFGGVLQGLSNGVDWQSGARLLLLMFAGVTLGGLGTAYGALVGSIIVGLFVEISALFIPPELKNVGALVVLIVILVFRPQGILGRSERVG